MPTASPTSRTYEDWLTANNARPQAGVATTLQSGPTVLNDTTRRGGSQYQPPVGPAANGPTGGPLSSFAYTPGQSNASFVQDNVRRDLTTGRGIPGIGQVGRAYMGYRAFKKAQASERREQGHLDDIYRRAQAAAPTGWLNTFDPTSRTAQTARIRGAGDSPMSADEIELGLRQEGQERQRAGMTRSVEEYFSAPERSQWQAGIVGDRLNASLGQIDEDYDRNLTGSVQGSAAQGLVGGSMDVERRGGVARARDTSAIGAAGQADMDLSNFRQQDADSRRSLLGMVNSGGYADSEGFSQALRDINDQTNNAAQQYSLGQQRRELSQFGRQQQSQVLGQGLNSFAGFIRQDPYRSSTSAGGW